MHPLALTGTSKMVAALILGVAIGFVLVRSRLAFRKTLIDQFSFKDNTFAIIFLVSVTVGVPIFYFCSYYGIINLKPSSYHFWGVIIGALFTGVGISLCGHTPTTAIASIGTGKIYSLWILLGMLSAFPVAQLASPILNDYVFKHSTPSGTSSFINDSIFFSGHTFLLYLIPIACIILALFLRLINAPGASGSSNPGKSDTKG